MTMPQQPHDPGQQYPTAPGYPGAYPPPGYPVAPPEPPKKKSKAKAIIIGAALAIVVLCGIGIAAISGGDSGSSDHTAGAPATDNGSGNKDSGNKDSAKIGTPVRDGKFEFVVSDVQTGLSSVGDNPYLTEKAQGQFVVISMSVKNTSKQPQGFSPSNQKLFDASGASFDPDTSAQVALGGADLAVWDNINPGNSVNVKLVFDMPADAKPSAIELHDSMFSGGQKVSLVK